MLNQNPFGSFRKECEASLEKVVKKLYPDFVLPRFVLDFPPNPQYGDLASSICFELSKVYKENPEVLASKITDEILKLKLDLVGKVESSRGYINFFVNLPKLTELTVNLAEKLKKEFGLVKTDKPEKIIVEHTSANPSGPLHVGTARNAILGDALARILKARGHNIQRHFYVDDVGRQVAIVAYGYKLLGEPKITEKPDKWLGFIYTATNCAVEIKTLKERIAKTQDQEELGRLKRKLDEYAAIAVELESTHKEEFYKILEGVNSDPNPNQTIEKIIVNYEKGEKETKKLVKKIVKACLRGFKETLRKAGITFDYWDWESSLVWSGEVEKAVKGLKETPYVFTKDGALVFNVQLAAETLGVKQKLFGESLLEIPSLVLVRSGGTTLYTTRDIAYHLQKFRWADKAINVVGVEQKLAQLQLKTALLVLGVKKALDSLIHYAYELVKLPDYKMSRRRGKYITFDELMDEAITMALSEVSKRSPNLPEKQKRQIAEAVGIGAVKYTMLSVSATKTVVFSWDKVLNFEANAAPYIQYAHARASSILRKAKIKPSKPDYTLLQNPLEKQLVVKLSRFPEVFCEAADNLKPELLAEYANDLADVFNAFYNKLPVLKAENKALRDARLKLVKTTKTVLENTLHLLGIKTPGKM